MSEHLDRTNIEDTNNERTNVDSTGDGGTPGGRTIIDSTQNTSGNSGGWSNMEQTGKIDPNLSNTPSPEGFSNTVMSNKESNDPTKVLPGNTQDAALRALMNPESTMAEATDSIQRKAGNSSSNMFGEYELLKEIARGGMGVVYRANQPKLGRIVALKMILPGLLNSSLAVTRFYQEAQAAAILDHGNIVPIYDIGEAQGQHFFTMAFIEGTSLKHYVLSKIPPLHETVKLMKGIADGVEFAHQHGIIHRDLKPDNVLIDKHGRPRITDFGLAKRAETDTGLTATGQVLGTPAYMSPEQALGGKRDIGPPTDIYALGGILYFALCGKTPFIADTMTEMLCQVMSSPPLPLSEHNPDIPPELEAICLKCLEKKPEDRYASAGEFREALNAWENKQVHPATQSYLDLRRVTPPLTPKEQMSDLLQQTSKVVVNTVPLKTEPTTTPMPVQGSETDNARPSKIPVIVFSVMVLLTGIVVATQWKNWFGSPSPTTTEIASGSESKTETKTNTNTSETKENPVNKAGQPKEVADKNNSRPKGIDPILLQDADLRKQFKVDVRMIGGQVVDGIRVFKDTDVVQFEIKPERDCYISIFSLNSDGTFDPFFPASQDPNDFFEANKPRMVPSKNAEITLSASASIDQVWIVASTKSSFGKQGDTNFERMLKERKLTDLKKTRGMQMRDKTEISEIAFPYKVVSSKD